MIFLIKKHVVTPAHRVKTRIISTSPADNKLIHAPHFNWRMQSRYWGDLGITTPNYTCIDQSQNGVQPAESQPSREIKSNVKTQANRKCCASPIAYLQAVVDALLVIVHRAPGHENAHVILLIRRLSKGNEGPVFGTFPFFLSIVSSFILIYFGTAIALLRLQTSF